ncbi:SH3 domain-containing protein [Reichenbachiella ulvae]|uniref:SH3 domain-containing protein n=1 Tax=Reichenbachiella ulvae TaxID=2980104 RepID=A0ABT3CZ95_9BACT|nr:SH3 domain-containing protein [Reichenbachiella ulvae]MCV9388884.1 SH3 domain-containing protein [Reichenbachiella ulvae]
MKKALALLILLFITQHFTYCFDSCDWQTIGFVSSSNGINLRDQPSLEGKKIAVIPFWEPVAICTINAKEATIDGVWGSWVKARYKQMEGYVFDPYLAKSEVFAGDDPDYRLSLEHDGCGRTDFDPTLNWYGIYEEGEQYILKSVEINMERDSQSEGIPMHTNLPQESVFLIASKTPLQTNQSLGKINPQSETCMGCGRLYPGQTRRIFLQKEKGIISHKTLNAIGTVNSIVCEEYTHCLDIENYQLRCSELNYDQSSHQNLSPIIYQGKNSLAELVWYGDLNSDNELDLIFVVYRMEGGHYTLLMSDSNVSKQLKRVAMTFWGCD